MPETVYSVSVIIVNFNGGKLLTECVRSVLTSNIPVEVFVIDNHSTDQSLINLQKTFSNQPQLQIIANPKNVGFAVANNQVLELTQAEYCLFLNPDCVIKSDTLQRMLTVLQQYPQVGMAGCLIRNPDGSEQAGCRRSIPTPWRALMRVLKLDKLFPQQSKFKSFVLTDEPLPKHPIEVEAISGAFMFVRRQALNEVGPLDENYFLHCEDLDWCVRFLQADWKVLFIPDIDIVHTKGTCSADRPIRVLWHMHTGMVRFYKKFFRQGYCLPLMLLVIIAVWFRFVILALLTFIRR